MNLRELYEKEVEDFHLKAQLREEKNLLGYIRFQKIAKLMGGKKGKVLDIGCGGVVRLVFG